MVAAPPLVRLSVEDAVQQYLRGVRRAVQGHSLSKATAENYERDLAEFIELVGADTILDDLTASDIDDAVLAYGSKPDARFAPKSGRPVKTRGVGAQTRFRQSVSRLFKEAVLEGWVEADPMPRTKVKPKSVGLRDAAREAMPASAASALLDVVSAATDPGGRPKRADMRLGLRDAFLLRLFMEGGPRVSEVCGANRSDLSVDDDGNHWLTVLGKGRKIRRVPLSPGTREAYDAYIEHERPQAKPRTVVDRDSGERVETVPVSDAEAALVLTWRGLRMTPRDMQLMVKRASERLPADVRRRVTPHGLRHTAATLLLASGAADIKTVKEILGHASISTTGIYLDSVDGEAARAVRLHPVTGDLARP